MGLRKRPFVFTKLDPGEITRIKKTAFPLQIF